VLRMDESAWEVIRRHGEEAYPHESCGVLVGRSEGEARTVVAAIRCGNIQTDSPKTRYQIDPLEILRVAREARPKGLDVVGFYHSHPDHPARPSATDLAEAHWFGCSYVITRVERGRADDTCSFVLVGGEAEKRFGDEEISIAPQAARAGSEP
jgi:proteasome lid subunit RPN8/RPN11